MFVFTVCTVGRLIMFSILLIISSSNLYLSKCTQLLSFTAAHIVSRLISDCVVSFTYR